MLCNRSLRQKRRHAPTKAEESEIAERSPVMVAAIKAARNPRLEHWWCLSKQAKACERERLGPEIPLFGLAWRCT
jgi:hypothetical protein